MRHERRMSLLGMFRHAVDMGAGNAIEAWARGMHRNIRWMGGRLRGPSVGSQTPGWILPWILDPQFCCKMARGL
eukprot:6834578-Lingulodinium_polyedra.AAC.1